MDIKKNARNFLEELRSSSDERKKRWLWGASAAAMVIVVYAWLAYFGTIVPSVSEPAGNAPAAAPEGGGVFASLRRGTAFVYGIFSDGVRGIEKTVGTPSEYIVKPRQ